MVETGVVYGRFQMLHLKHLEYILAAKMRSRKLYIGIEVPDSSCFSAEEDAEYRLTKGANPLTYLERYEMLRDALLDFGVRREEFDIIPFPVDKKECLMQYAPKEATYFLSICDEDTVKSRAVLEGLELKTEVMWTRETEKKGTSGAEVRQRILASEEWSNLVPKTVYEYVKKHGIDNRIRFSK